MCRDQGCVCHVTLREFKKFTRGGTVGDEGKVTGQKY